MEPAEIALFVFTREKKSANTYVPHDFSINNQTIENNINRCFLYSDAYFWLISVV